MANKKAIYKVDNGTGYDELWFKTSADQVYFTDGKTFQQKLDEGSLRGPQGIAGVTGDKGATFTPSVNSEGVLSWTNDKGLENPVNVNIKGPQGIQGPAGSTGTTWKPAVDSSGNLTWTTATGTPASANIRGPQGPQGPAGVDATPHVFSESQPSGHIANRVWIHLL